MISGLFLCVARSSLFASPLDGGGRDAQDLRRLFYRHSAKVFQLNDLYFARIDGRELLQRVR